MGGGVWIGCTFSVSATGPGFIFSDAWRGRRAFDNRWWAAATKSSSGLEITLSLTRWDLCILQKGGRGTGIRGLR